MKSFVAYTHPILAERIESDVCPRADERFNAYLIRLGFTSNYISNVFINGTKQSRADLIAVRLQPTDRIGIVPIVAGGDGSDPFQIVLTLAVIVAASYFAPGFATHFGISESLARGILGVGGLIIASFLIGPPKLPRLPDPQEQTYDDVYTISGGSNQRALYAPAQIVLGKHRVFPLYAADTYTQYINQDQYLYTIFHWGFGDLRITNRKIGTTDLDQYANVQTEFLKGGRSTIVADDIFTIEGVSELEIEDENDATKIFQFTKTTPDDTVRVGVDFNFILYRINAEGDFVNASAVLKIESRATGTTDWTTLETFTQTGATQEVARITKFYRLATKGEYDIRVSRLQHSESDDGFRAGSIQRKVSVPLIKCEQETVDNAYELENREAIVIQATGQLNNVVDKYYADVAQIIPVYDKDSDSWVGGAVDKPISNPAAIMRFVLKGLFYANGERVFGVGMSDADIHYASLNAWFLFCEREQLSFNYVQTIDEHIDEVLRRVCTAGRASPQFFGTQLGVVFDDETDEPKALYSADNIIYGTFKADFNVENIADSIKASFINADNEYKTDELHIGRGDVSQPINPISVQLEGITNELQARRAANLIIAENEYHNASYVFQTDVQGLLSRRGDVILLAKPRLSQSGRISKIGNSFNEIVLDRDVLINNGSVLAIRSTTGKMFFSSITDYDADTNTITFDDAAMRASIRTAKRQNRLDSVLWFIYNDDDPVKARITEMEFKRDGVVRIACRPFVDAYYAAKDNAAEVVSSSKRIAVEIYDVEYTQSTIYVDGVYRRLIKFFINSNRPIIEAEIYDAFSGELLKVIRQTNTFDLVIPGEIERTYTINIRVLNQSYVQVSVPFDKDILKPKPLTDLEIEDCQDCLRINAVYDLSRDFEGFEVRWALGNARVDWDAMRDAHAGYITNLPATILVYARGVIQIAARVVNKGGVASDVYYTSTTLKLATRTPDLSFNMKRLGWDGRYSRLTNITYPISRGIEPASFVTASTQSIDWNDWTAWNTPLSWVSGLQAAKTGFLGNVFSAWFAFGTVEIDKPFTMRATIQDQSEVRHKIYYAFASRAYDNLTGSVGSSLTFNEWSAGDTLTPTDTNKHLFVVLSYELSDTDGLSVADGANNRRLPVSAGGVFVDNMILDLFFID